MILTVLHTYLFSKLESTCDDIQLFWYPRHKPSNFIIGQQTPCSFINRLKLDRLHPLHISWFLRILDFFKTLFTVKIKLSSALVGRQASWAESWKTDWGKLPKETESCFKSSSQFRCNPACRLQLRTLLASPRAGRQTFHRKTEGP